VAVEIEQIAPHLWWWTAPHPEWSPSDFKDGRGWERDVSSYALVDDGSLVLFDPLVPAGDEERFWAALDGDVVHHGPPSILISLHWHARSAGAILERKAGRRSALGAGSARTTRGRSSRPRCSGRSNATRSGCCSPTAAHGRAQSYSSEARA
jgi:hypothetical protein